jgi:hypothetical protein
MNTKTLYVKVMGMLVPIDEASLVQVSPNDPRMVVQEMPLTQPLEALVEHNLKAFEKVHATRGEWIKENT